MSLDRDHLKTLLADIDGLIAELPIGDTLRKHVKEKVFGPALNELRMLVNDSRAPILYVLGRSGDGKSSMINALTGREVAPVGHIEPTTPNAEKYTVEFGRDTTWTILDSRGIFDSATPEGAPEKDAVDQVCVDISRHKPDVLCHVVSPPTLRTFAPDRREMKKIREKVEKRSGHMPPSLMVVSKVDVLGNPRAWPPTAHAEKRDLIEQQLNFGTTILQATASPIDPMAKYLGSHLSGGELFGGDYLAMVPVSLAPAESAWNIETLTSLIGDRLPTSAQLQFFQAKRDQRLLRKVSERLVRNFATGAAAVATFPFPFEDIFLITPLQLCMISVVGSLSGRPLSKDTALEFLAAAGFAVSAGMAVRLGASTIMKLVPAFGSLVGAGLAYSGTIALGRAAEAYFFDKAAAQIPASPANPPT